MKFQESNYLPQLPSLLFCLKLQKYWEGVKLRRKSLEIRENLTVSSAHTEFKIKTITTYMYNMKDFY